MGVGLGVVLAGRRRLAALLTAFFVLASIPWLLLNATRPVIGWQPRTKADSVFKASSADLLFANWTFRRDSYLHVTEVIKDSGCREVGLVIDSHDLEYPFWWLLDAPQSGIQIEVLTPKPHLQRFADPTFEPCAIVCAVCGGRTRLHGLELETSEQGVSLYSGEGFTPDMDG